MATNEVKGPRDIVWHLFDEIALHAKYEHCRQPCKDSTGRDKPDVTVLAYTEQAFPNLTGEWQVIKRGFPN